MKELIIKIADDFKHGFKTANLIATMYSKGILNDNDLKKLNGKKGSNRS